MQSNGVVKQTFILGWTWKKLQVCSELLDGMLVQMRRGQVVPISGRAARDNLQFTWFIRSQAASQKVMATDPKVVFKQLKCLKHT